VNKDILSLNVIHTIKIIWHTQVDSENYIFKSTKEKLTIPYLHMLCTY